MSIAHSKQIAQVLSDLEYKNFHLLNKRIFVNGRPYDRVERARITQRFRDLGMRVNPGALRDVIYLRAAGYLDSEGNHIDKAQMDREQRLSDFETHGINRLAWGQLVPPGTWVRGLHSVNNRRCKRYAEHWAVVIECCPYCGKRHFHYWAPDGPAGNFNINNQNQTHYQDSDPPGGPDPQPGIYHGHRGTMFRLAMCRENGDPMAMGYTICIQVSNGLDMEITQ